jgi:hypothetical protein
MESDVTVWKKKSIPWPGPRPYDEEHWEDFYGRDRDLRELLGRVPIEKLTVLLGASGTGKTSLIRAGLVPMLRQQRYHPQGDPTVWPVLLLRRWGAVSSNSLAENVLLQFDSAIDAIRDWGARLGQERAIADAENLRTDLEASRRENPGPLNVLEVVEMLAREQVRRSDETRLSAAQESLDPSNRGGLILIFDQFEEQLRAGRQASSDALKLIGNIVRSGAPTRVLLSMRQEYRYALRPLELFVGEVSRRSYFLESMKKPTVVEVIKESSSNSNVQIDMDVAERIVEWLASITQAIGLGVLGETQEGKEADLQDKAGRPDLLQLQAVLLELSHYAIVKQQGRVTTELFEEFTEQFADNSDLREEILAQRVLDGALERWIEAALCSEAIDVIGNPFSDDRSHSYAKWSNMQLEDLGLQVRRIAIRLAPLLSSGDYKVAQEENALFRQALGDEMGRLGLKDPEVRSGVRVIENEEGPARLNWEDLNLADAPAWELPSILSGLARVENWSPAQTGDQILICFKETLHRLAMANILQYTSFESDNGRYWELVHDQFGPSFTKWAARQRGTWDDCKNSLVVCSGIQPIAVSVSEIKPPPGNEVYDLVKISWQNCRIENSRSDRLTLRNVRFRECYLVGTIFDAVDFVGCSFEKCVLKSGLFRGCIFRADENGRPTLFDECDANIAIVGGHIEDLEFRNCHLLQPAIDGTSLVGEIRYTEGTRVIQGYVDVRVSSADKSRILFYERSRAALCLWGHETYSILKFEDQDLDQRNSSLMDDFRVRP